MTINFPKPPKFLTSIILIVVIALLSKECGRSSGLEQKLADKEDQRQREQDSMQHAFDMEWEESVKREYAWYDSMEVYKAESEVLRYERDQSWAALGKSKKEADKLIGKIQELNGADSIACMELTYSYLKAADQVVFYKAKTDTLIRKLDTAGKYKDRLIANAVARADSAKAANDKTYIAYTILKSSFDRLRPHGSVWVGGDATVLPGMILAGSQFAYQSKKGSQYILAFGLDSKDVQYYVRAGVLWKISFRRK